MGEKVVPNKIRSRDGQNSWRDVLIDLLHGPGHGEVHTFSFGLALFQSKQARLVTMSLQQYSSSLIKDHQDGGRLVHNVPTCVQNYSWDCGLASASMVLRFLGKSASKVYTVDLEELNCGESIWTIDLALLMKKYDIKHRFCTITLGVDKEYSKQAFYSTKFSSDEERVSKLFADSVSLGIMVEKRSVSKEDIFSHVESGNVLIVLVDDNKMECLWCDRKTCKICLSCVTSTCCDRYQGHYVVVCGIDRKKKRVFYKNPSYNEDLCCCRIDKLDAARKSFGTDEDILFIYKDGVS